MLNHDTSTDPEDPKTPEAPADPAPAEGEKAPPFEKKDE